MTSKKDGGQNSIKPSEGFAAGLKLWLLFLIGFKLLGYPISSSILLGAIGGLAGGWVAAWWRMDEPDKPIEENTGDRLPTRRSITAKKNQPPHGLLRGLPGVNQLFGKKNS